MARLLIPTGAKDCQMNVAGRQVRLTNLSKVFWPDLGITKRDLLQYYADVSQALLAPRNPALMTAEYKKDKRPHGRVLVDYNQNAWGRTLASIYSVRPRPHAPVSTPVTWKEVEGGIRIEDFRLDNVPKRLSKKGDLWKPLLLKTGRFDLEKFATAAARARSSRQ